MTLDEASNGTMRDPVADHLLTPQNSALVVIDYQPSQVQTVTSIDHQLLTDNIVSVARLAKTFNLPVVLSTVGVNGRGQAPTIPELKAVLHDNPEIDRSEINSWENNEFRDAVKATGRKKLIMTALWTEVCLAFPAARRTSRRLRGVPGGRRGGWNLTGGAPGRTRTRRPGRRAADQLGVPGL